MSVYSELSIEFSGIYSQECSTGNKCCWTLWGLLLSKYAQDFTVDSQKQSEMRPVSTPEEIHLGTHNWEIGLHFHISFTFSYVHERRPLSKRSTELPCVRHFYHTRQRVSQDFIGRLSSCSWSFPISQNLQPIWPKGLPRICKTQDCSLQSPWNSWLVRTA